MLQLLLIELCLYVLSSSCLENGTIVTTTTTPALPSGGDVRLTPGPSKGRLEYYKDGKWGAVCSEGWDRIDAVVACRQLGYG